MYSVTQFATVLRRVLRVSDDLRKSKYRGDPNPYRGHCYVSSEAAYHMLGGQKSGWKPHVLRVSGDTHWYLLNEKGKVFDPTWDQFKTPIKYDEGRACGFLTREPSKRARELISRAKRK